MLIFPHISLPSSLYIQFFSQEWSVIQANAEQKTDALDDNEDALKNILIWLWLEYLYKSQDSFFFDLCLMNLKAKKNSQLLSMNYKSSFP